MKHLFLAVFLLACLPLANVQAQCTGVPILPSQDCPGAIPLCGLRYTYPTGAICGGGNNPGELPSGSCLTDEHNSTWYVFKIRKAGQLKFAIVPLDVVAPDDSGDTDYDWALFKLPAGATNNTSTCSMLAGHTDWQASCNYAGGKGATGMMDTSGTANTNSQNAGGTKWNQPIIAARDEVYLLIVDNFTGGVATGYTIRFRDTSDIRTGEDIQLGIATIAPTSDDFYFQSVSLQPTQVLLTTDRYFQCSRMTPSAIRVYDPNNLGQAYAVQSFGPEGSCPTGFTNTFHLAFTPYDSSRVNTLNLVVRDTIYDICGHITTSDTLTLRAGLRVVNRKSVTLGGFSLYPQPNGGQFSVDLRGLNRQDGRLEITEVATGRKVWKSAIRGSLVNDISPKTTLRPGIYMVEVSLGNRRFTQKMVVAR